MIHDSSVERNKSVVYARAVNGVRRYFYSLSDLNIFEESNFRVLPIKCSVPEYKEWRFFFPIILSFSIINCCYFNIFLYNYYNVLNFSDWYPMVGFVSIFWITLYLPIVLYIELASYREKIYFTQPVIGLDIDGVLNKHREHFCELFEKKFNEKIDPEDITKIPVHECKKISKAVTDEKEKLIFNDTDYWIKMPIADDCSRIIKKLKMEHNYRIEIFSYRPWPIKKRFPADDAGKKEYEKKWSNISFLFRLNKGAAIKKITKNWLNKNGIYFDKLTIEKSSIYQYYPKSFKVNRFQRARKRQFKIFVEDEFEKAERLSKFCDIVFLIDHPYNRLESKNKNIIRVQDWNELYRIVKEDI